MSEMQDSALEAFKKYCDAHGIRPLPPVLCQWCSDRGCISCADARKKRQEQLDAAYKAQFPNGPQPIFTARADKPEEMEQLKEIFHADKITAAFGPGGSGMAGIEKKCKEIMEKRDERS